MGKNIMLPLKETKGNKKMKRYFEKLTNNEVFKKEMIKLYNSINSKKWRANLYKFCSKYGIDFSDLETIALAITNDEPILSFGLDVCKTEYSEFKYLTNKIKINNLILDKKDLIAADDAAYPVSIKLNLLATKNEIIDYVDKNWHQIKGKLNNFRNKKNLQHREMKNKEIYCLVQKNINKKNAEIKKIIDKNFSKTVCTLADINSIKYEIKKQSLKDISPTKNKS